jgi:hypothetical protein
VRIRLYHTAHERSRPVSFAIYDLRSPAKTQPSFRLGDRDAHPFTLGFLGGCQDPVVTADLLGSSTSARRQCVVSSYTRYSTCQWIIPVLFLRVAHPDSTIGKEPKFPDPRIPLSASMLTLVRLSLPHFESPTIPCFLRLHTYAVLH